MWLVVVHFTCLKILSIPHYCTVSIFPWPICFKNGTFSLENHTIPKKYCQEGFFRLTYVKLKHQSNEHNQASTNNFWHLIWIFWVCWLSPAWYNIYYSPLTSQFGGYQTVEHRLVRKLHHETLHTPLHTLDKSQHLLYTLHKSFFGCFSCFFTFLEIINHNMLKILLFYIFTIKMIKQTLTHFHKLVFLNAHCYDSCHMQSNKLFQMKLKTSKLH